MSNDFERPSNKSARAINLYRWFERKVDDIHARQLEIGFGKENSELRGGETRDE